LIGSTMFNLLATSLQDRLLRIAVLCVFLTGFAHAAILPFMSIIAIERLGLSAFDYALMQVISAILSVSASIAIGIFTDQTGRYQEVLITSILAGIGTGAIMYFIPSQLSFIIMLTVLAPIAATGFSQYFALAHLAASINKKLDKDFSTAFVRAAYSSTYVITPTIVVTIFASGADIWVIFGLSAIVSTIVLFVVATSWPKDVTPERKKTSGNVFLNGLRQLATFSILIPVMLVAILLGVNLLYFNLLGLLVLNNFGGVEADIALFSGGVALVEIPIMLSGAIILRYLTKSSLLLISIPYSLQNLRFMI
jgi:SET family sugar efflux transporter-like MFS transporter